MQTMVELLQTFGFAAICCGAMAFFVKYMFDKYEARLEGQRKELMQINSEQRREFLDRIQEITDSHAAESAKLAESIDKLAERIDGMEARK